MIRKNILLHGLLLLLLGTQTVFGIDNLKLNSKLDYQSDSLDGPLITGADAQSGFVPGRTNYVIIYGEGCFKVELYNKYRNQVHFVVVDLDVKRSPEQQQLVKQYYEGSIPHVLVLDGNGKPLYNSAGEVDCKHVEAVFAQSFNQSAGGTK